MNRSRNSKAKEANPSEKPGASIPARLASIRATSNTTLGGAQKVRFQPKAPARRIKQETPEESNSYWGNDKPKNSKGAGLYGQAVSQNPAFRTERNPRRAKNELIQPVTGPFAMGPASVGQAKAGGRSGMQPSRDGGGQIVHSEAINMKSELQQIGTSAKMAEKEEMEDYIYNSEDDELDGQGDAKMAPFVLLTDQNAQSSLWMDDTKPDLAEPNESSSNDDATTVAQLFETDTDFNNLILLQLPETLTSFSSYRPATQTTPPTLQSSAVSELEDVKPNLADLDSKQHVNTSADNAKTENSDATALECDGQIGELLIHASGKVSLDVGGIRINMNKGIDCQFSQQLFALDLDTKQLFAFGSIRNKLICIPDLDSLFESMAL
ncbi:hypothetical protein BB560_001632 [Smittium megazygosporum]|uniref:DNA-directed RNA polymerase III subunit RPC4 n=1 Tax=Smittium megazygosporum TaxID=133381 RepID=A0A2T9ZGZ9_9FUNG|nr:hypothetical protein BB560_001632 [Smittium megazygosporum]